jgi:hypothetical protein
MPGAAPSPSSANTSAAEPPALKVKGPRPNDEEFAAALRKVKNARQLWLAVLAAQAVLLAARLLW